MENQSPTPQKRKATTRRITMTDSFGFVWEEHPHATDSSGIVSWEVVKGPYHTITLMSNGAFDIWGDSISPDALDWVCERAHDWLTEEHVSYPAPDVSEFEEEDFGDDEDDEEGVDPEEADAARQRATDSAARLPDTEEPEPKDDDDDATDQADP